MKSFNKKDYYTIIYARICRWRCKNILEYFHFVTINKRPMNESYKSKLSKSILIYISIVSIKYIN